MKKIYVKNLPCAFLKCYHPYMEFLSPLSDIFTEKKEFNSIIKHAKDCQLNSSLKRIKEFCFLDNGVVDEVFPEDTPEIILEKRRNIKYL